MEADHRLWLHRDSSDVKLYYSFLFLQKMPLCFSCPTTLQFLTRGKPSLCDILEPLVHSLELPLNVRLFATCKVRNFFIAAPCILIYVEFTHQQRHFFI